MLVRSTKSLGALGATGRDAAAWVVVLSGSERNAGQPMAIRKRRCGLGALLMTGKPLADGTGGEPDSLDGPLEVMPLLPLPPAASLVVSFFVPLFLSGVFPVL